MQALVINLKKSNKRWEFMSNQLSNVGITFFRIDAYDSCKISNERYKKYLNSWERPLRKVELACFFSHKKAWELVVQNNKPYLILEDDVILDKRIVNILDIVESIEDYKFINLEATTRSKLISNKSVKVLDGYKLHRLYHNKSGAAAYIIWPEVAKRLLSKYTENRAAISDAALYNNFFKWNQYQLNPGMAIQFQYCKQFGITIPFKDASSIASVAKPFKPRLLFKFRRYKTQLSIILVQLVCISKAKYVKVKVKINSQISLIKKHL